MMPDKSSAKETSRGFPAVTGEQPSVLILGSLPGRASLDAGEYYAQPRNAFWSIMGALCGAHPALAYSERLSALGSAGVALWDVLQQATRPGSLDSNIVSGTERVNDIPALLAEHPSIRLIAFNGKKSAEIFRRRVERELAISVATAVLPSTSAAYASLRLEDKLTHWREVLAPHLRAV